MRFMAMSLFASVGLVAMTGSVTAAQTMVVVVTSLGDRETTRLSLTSSPVNERDCTDDSVGLVLDHIMVTGDMQVLDLWRGPAGTDCANQASRVDLTRTCTPITLGETLTFTSLDITRTLDPAPLSELLDCATAGSFDIYFLLADSPMTLGPVSTYGVLSIVYDNVPPTAPAGITGGSGNTSVLVSWTNPDEVNLREERVYAVPTASGCGSDSFTIGQPVPSEAVAIATASGLATSVSVDLSVLGLAVGEGADITVVAVDQALNESVVGEVVCVTRIDDATAVDAGGGGGSPDGGACGCRVVRAPASHDHAIVSMVCVGALVALRRKRRRHACRRQHI